MGARVQIDRQWGWGDLPRIEFGFNGNRTRPRTEDWRLTLLTGREVRLGAFYQQDTNRGMLCGLPLPHVREGQLEAATNSATRIFQLIDGDCVHILPPALFHYTANLAHPKDPPNICELDALPPVCSMAEFWSNSPVRHQAHVYSSLHVVWFQDHYGLPNDPSVIDLMKAMPWDDLANDWTP